MHFTLFVCVPMAEKKVQKTKGQSDYLSHNGTSEEEVNPHICMSEEERIYGTIKGSAQATQAALSHTLCLVTFHTYIYYCTFLTLFLLNVFPFIMNASSWKKAVDLVAQVIPANPQVQAASMVESQQLESLPLSTLSVDNSGPPQVTYDSQQPMAKCTPRPTSTLTPETPTEAYN